MAVDCYGDTSNFGIATTDQYSPTLMWHQNRTNLSHLQYTLADIYIHLFSTVRKQIYAKHVRSTRICPRWTVWSVSCIWYCWL